MKISKFGSTLAFFLMMATFTACDNQGQKAAAPAAETATQESVSSAKQVDLPLVGKAKEVLSGGGYTYVLINNDTGETWAAMPATEVAAGEKVTITDGQMMTNFPSKSLNRTFANILFANGIEGKGPKPASPQGGAMMNVSMTNPHGSMGDNAAASDFTSALSQESGGAQAIDPGAEVSMGSSKAIVPFVELSLEKANGANGYTVSEVFAKAEDLNGKTVRIKGQVVKFSPQIMGTNWLHLQDGTGDPQKNTHDLVVTSPSQAGKGDIVTVEGVLAANKDFGFGYKYNVIIENVTVSK